MNKDFNPPRLILKSIMPVDRSQVETVEIEIYEHDGAAREMIGYFKHQDRIATEPGSSLTGVTRLFPPSNPEKTNFDVWCSFVRSYS